MCARDAVVRLVSAKRYRYYDERGAIILATSALDMTALPLSRLQIDSERRICATNPFDFALRIFNDGRSLRLGLFDDS